MKEQLGILKALGMKPKEAMLFLKQIALDWYTYGQGHAKLNEYTDELGGKQTLTFDTFFSKKLGDQQEKKEQIVDDYDYFSDIH